MRDEGRDVKGFIYFIQAVDKSGPIKIGHTVNPKQRLEQLQIAHYEPLFLLGVIPGTMNDEEEIHKALLRSCIRGEWHRPSEEVLALVARTEPAPTIAKMKSAHVPAPVEREKIEAAIAAAYDLTEAAQLLGCSRRTLQNRMRQLKIPPGKAGRRHKRVADPRLATY